MTGSSSWDEDKYRLGSKMSSWSSDDFRFLFNSSLLRSSVLFESTSIWVKPRTRSSSATPKKLRRSSWLTDTSPLYIKSRMAWMSSRRTLCRKMKGCKKGCCDGLLSIDLNTGEQADKTSLWALKVWPWEIRVTSNISSLSRRSRKHLFKLEL